MAKGKAGRKRVTEGKTKKLKLTLEQRRYALMLKGINANLEKKKAALERADAEIKTAQDKRNVIAGEVGHLTGAKAALEGILNQNPPAEWPKFVAAAYEYHYHYHLCEKCHCAGCKCHEHFYVSPWWTWYQGGTWVYPPTYIQTINTNLPLQGVTNIPAFSIPSNDLTSGSLLLTSQQHSGVVLNNGVADSPNFSFSGGGAGPTPVGVMATSVARADGYTAGPPETANFTSTSGTMNLGEAEVKAVLSDFGFFNE